MNLWEIGVWTCGRTWSEGVDEQFCVFLECARVQGYVTIKVGSLITLKI
jgi:hypothetical protein